VRRSGELFYVTVCFGLIAVIRLVSSIVLTRILYPEAYGLVALIGSIVFTVEMMSDLGVATVMVRHAKAETEPYLTTLWTIRFARSAINGLLVLIAAPWLADIYNTPELTAPLQCFSIFFLLQGLESMSLQRAIRNKRASRVSIVEVISLAFSTALAIAVSLYTRDHVGMVVGIIANRGAVTALSYALRDPFRPRFAFDREVWRELFLIARFVMPSSMLTMAISQFDKVIFLRLFDLALLGLYGLAANVIQAVDALVTTLTQNVLTPHMAEAFRRDRPSATSVYYRDNARLHAFVLALPAAVAGFAHLIVEILFDPRYAGAALILQAFAARSVTLAFYSSSENLLVASGHNHIGLTGNVLRACWLVPGVLIGHHFLGFHGFLVMAVLYNLPGICYYYWLQAREGLVVVRYEAYRVTLVATVFAAASSLAPLGSSVLKALKASLTSML
jgi:lipopolysaccharide exporter